VSYSSNSPPGYKYTTASSYPHLSHRPKILHLDLSSIAVSLAKTNKEGFKISLGRIIPLIVNLATRSKPSSVSEIVAVFLDALPRLTAVTKLYVKHDYSGACCDHPLIRQSLRDIWRVFGDRLQSLQVHVIFENLELLLPTSLHLPCLELFTVQTEGLNSIAASACESIIPTTVKSHASSLRSVSFTTENAAVDPRPIFQSLQLLPCLRAIHLSFPFGPSVPSPFPAYDLLYSCRGFLEFLSLDFGTYMREHASRSLSLFREDWCFVDLPRLSELRIDPPIMTLRQDFIDYIHRFAPSLISLWIKPHLVLRVHETYQLSSIFHNFLFLRNLSICIHLFCPDILALLARTLSCLQTLTLGYLIVSPTTAGLQFFGRELSRQVTNHLFLLTFLS